MKQKKQTFEISNNYQKPNKLKDCKVEKYKIDNDSELLYKITNSINELEPRILKTMPLDFLQPSTVDFFFKIMESFQCEEFTIYYENDYDIIKIINLLSNTELDLTSEQLIFLKNFFKNIAGASISLFDKRLKPIINNLTDSTIDSSNSISKTMNSIKQRVLN